MAAVKNIIIVGGGIGGLSAALALHQHGFHCAIVEQLPALDDELGAGIQISPNAMRVLSALGLSEKLQQVAFEPDEAVLRDYKSGKPEMTMMLKGFCEQRYGMKYLHLHRADLLGVLADAVRSRGIKIHLGARARAYEQDDNSITLKLENGATLQADLIIGADGIHSTIIHSANSAGNSGGFALLPARFTGQVAWRGLVPSNRLPKDLIPADANVWLGPKAHFVSYYVRKGELINFVAVEERKDWTEESWNVKGELARLRETFSAWDRPIQVLLEACAESFLWGLFERAPLPCWSDGRAVLLGDACHPMLPFIAQGAAMAIEDGFVLARQLARTDDIKQALQLYEKLRKPRVTMIQKFSRDNAKLFHLASPLTRMARKTAFKVASLTPQINVAQARLDKIYGVDVTL